MEANGFTAGVIELLDASQLLFAEKYLCGYDKSIASYFIQVYNTPNLVSSGKHDLSAICSCQDCYSVYLKRLEKEAVSPSKVREFLNLIDPRMVPANKTLFRAIVDVLKSDPTVNVMKSAIGDVLKSDPIVNVMKSAIGGGLKAGVTGMEDKLKEEDDRLEHVMGEAAKGVCKGALAGAALQVNALPQDRVFPFAFLPCLLIGGGLYIYLKCAKEQQK